MIKELYTPMQIELQERARELAETTMRPVAAKYDVAQEYPWEVQKAIKAAGLSGVWIPEEYGGMGGGVLDLCIVVEEFSRACGGMGVGFAVNALGSFPIIVGGTDEQKERWLPGIAAGEKLIAFGLSEAKAGSDAGSMTTRAEKDGDHYVLNGEKKWNTGGAVAAYNTIFAVTNPDRGARGISAFIVDEGSPGYSVGKHEDKMGIRCVPVVEIHLDKCKVPSHAVHARAATVWAVGQLVPRGAVDAVRHGHAGRGRPAARASRRSRDRLGPQAHHEGLGHVQADGHRRCHEGDDRLRAAVRRLRVL
jgi:butyryl-CoA dehydrogenase